MGLIQGEGPAEVILNVVAYDLSGLTAYPLTTRLGEVLRGLWRKAPTSRYGVIPLAYPLRCSYEAEGLEAATSHEVRQVSFVSWHMGDGARVSHAGLAFADKQSQDNYGAWWEAWEAVDKDYNERWPKRYPLTTALERS